MLASRLESNPGRGQGILRPAATLAVLWVIGCTHTAPDSLAPSGAAIRARFRAPVDVTIVEASGQEVRIPRVQTLVGRVVTDSEDTVRVSVSTIQSAGQDTPQGVASGGVTVLVRDSNLVLEVVSGNPRTVELVFGAAVVVLIASYLVFLSRLGGGS